MIEKLLQQIFPREIIKIGGFEKASLVNYPGKIACTLWTFGCNLRCRFCYNRDLVLNVGKEISEEVILEDLKFIQTRNIVITGGEPLIQKDLLNFLIKLKNLDFSIKIDTNGFLPEEILKIVKFDNKLIQYVAVDLKGVTDLDIKYITRSDYKLEDMLKTIDIINQAGIDYELRYTAWKKYSEDEINRFIEMLDVKEGCQIYIQQMYGDSFLDKTFKSQVSHEDILSMQGHFKHLIPCKIRAKL